MRCPADDLNTIQDEIAAEDKPNAKEYGRYILQKAADKINASESRTAVTVK